jgi:hypothetical protein
MPASSLILECCVGKFVLLHILLQVALSSSIKITLFFTGKHPKLAAGLRWFNTFLKK